MKNDTVSISRRDSGNEFYTLGDAYKNMDWSLAKFKIVCYIMREPFIIIDTDAISTMATKPTKASCENYIYWLNMYCTFQKPNNNTEMKKNNNNKNLKKFSSIVWNFSTC